MDPLAVRRVEAQANEFSQVSCAGLQACGPQQTLESSWLRSEEWSLDHMAVLDSLIEVLGRSGDMWIVEPSEAGTWDSICRDSNEAQPEVLVQDPCACVDRGSCN